MWFRQGQSFDTDRVQASTKSRDIQCNPEDSEINYNIMTEDSSFNNDGINSDIDTLKLSGRLPSGRKGLDNKKSKADRKFKNNRILRSSSKGKIPDSDKHVDNLKNLCSNRNIVVPSAADETILSISTAAAKAHLRSYSHLNLNALLRRRFTRNQLTPNEFKRKPRKSICIDETTTGLEIKSSQEKSILDANKNSQLQGQPFLDDVFPSNRSNSDIIKSKRASKKHTRRSLHSLLTPMSSLKINDGKWHN